MNHIQYLIKQAVGGDSFPGWGGPGNQQDFMSELNGSATQSGFKKVNPASETRSMPAINPKGTAEQAMASKARFAGIKPQAQPSETWLRALDSLHSMVGDTSLSRPIVKRLAQDTGSFVRAQNPNYGASQSATPAAPELLAPNPAKTHYETTDVYRNGGRGNGFNTPQEYMNMKATESGVPKSMSSAPTMNMGMQAPAAKPGLGQWFKKMLMGGIGKRAAMVGNSYPIPTPAVNSTQGRVHDLIGKLLGSKPVTPEIAQGVADKLGLMGVKYPNNSVAGAAANQGSVLATVAGNMKGPMSSRDTLKQILLRQMARDNKVKGI